MVLITIVSSAIIATARKLTLTSIMLADFQLGMYNSRYVQLSSNNMPHDRGMKAKPNRNKTQQVKMLLFLLND